MFVYIDNNLDEEWQFEIKKVHIYNFHSQNAGHILIANSQLYDIKSDNYVNGQYSEYKDVLAAQKKREIPYNTIHIFYRQ